MSCDRIRRSVRAVAVSQIPDSLEDAVSASVSDSALAALTVVLLILRTVNLLSKRSCR